MPKTNPTKLDRASTYFIRINQRIRGYEDNHCGGVGAENPYDVQCSTHGFETMQDALLAAVDKHAPRQDFGAQNPTCCTCPGVIYPCPTVEAVANELGVML